MSTNPFAPPGAPTRDIDGPGVARVAKPVSAWLLQFACAIGITAVFAVIALSVKAMLLSDTMRWSVAAAHVAVDCAVMIWLAAAFVGAQRRTRYGRPLGLTVIGALFLLATGVFVRMMAADVQAGVPGAYLLGQGIGGAVLPLLCAWWWRAFGFSKGARAWFGTVPAPGARQAVRAAA